MSCDIEIAPVLFQDYIFHGLYFPYSQLTASRKSKNILKNRKPISPASFQTQWLRLKKTGGC
jgi:hypothetical protein